ncbi:peroxidase-like [Sitodiplosis mosellana]|uniref:peroxidase-like n=1 Tax=Sitodiplosis mosellana TaxID=263140 RepID=UPI002443E3DC|nr:peroxidase-like [Sitodiplosis mosellana]
MFIFAIEVFGPSKSNMKADVLLEYQRLVKRYGQCRRKTYKNCLHEAAQHIPLEDRCELPKGACNPHEKYSRVGGFCNNLKYPNIGKANTPYGRILEARYADGISEFRRTANDEEMPNARSLSNTINEASDFKCETVKCGDQTNNFVGIMFSQMVAHDTSSRKVVTMRGNNSNGISCCESSYSSPLPPNEINPSCIPIPLPRNDSFYSNKGIFCQSYVRMQPTLKDDCKIKYEHENIVSSYLDLNTIYSNSYDKLKGLRENYGGLFKMDPLNILPVDTTGQFTAGDFRFGQTPVLGQIHSLFYRFHNLIATNLGAVNPHWSNDDIFFETRRIVIAYYQHIIYYDWLPLVLGDRLCHSYKLTCRGKCDKYDPDIKATTTIEYAMNAFRFFHVNIPSNIHVVNDSGALLEKIPLSNTYLTVDILKEKYNAILRGMMKQKQRMNRVGYTGEVRNLFIKTKYRGKDVGVDGMILDIMRSRDSGTAPYIAYYPIPF